MGSLRLIVKSFRQTLDKNNTSMAAAFAGTWNLDKNENFDKFLQEVGVGVIKRKVAAGLKPKLTFSISANGFTLDNNKGKVSNVEWGVEKEDDIGSTPCSAIWKLEGNKMVGLFTIKKSGQKINFTREIVGGQLHQVLESNGVVTKRTFNKA